MAPERHLDDPDGHRRNGMQTGDRVRVHESNHHRWGGIVGTIVAHQPRAYPGREWPVMADDGTTPNFQPTEHGPARLPRPSTEPEP